MNEEDSVFSKAYSLVVVPYVEPLFLGSLNVQSMIPMSHGILMNDMKNVMCYMQCVMCYVLCARCYGLIAICNVLCARCYVLCEI